MNPIKRGVLLVTGALIAGGAGIWFGDRHLEQRASALEAELRSDHATRAVIVARDHLPEGSRLTRDGVAIRDMPVKFTHDSALAAPDWSGIAGRTLKREVAAGRAILPAHVQDTDRARLAEQVKPGDRAITIPVSGGAEIAGLLGPGDRLDLMLTYRNDGERETVPLLADIPILATGSELGDAGTPRGPVRYDDLTLAVSPLEAARITHALAIGDIHVVLRSDTDNAPVDGFRIDAAALIDTGPDADPGNAPPDIELIIGGQP
ncbi:Flp pilus assembly protein CpaB [Spiribacter vilamensis]|uniref:Pilus assembly protein CpaB n=1 Tax=Spiribacter vilamensis TaxID=531306 RepID=A0A4Q8D042_9GAMM|nr:Flp pilus assembly protein CpaB [Spiribacter vilamensis]RZU98643.1 pilus assembly protein CpaB [Spiribacter vilamensis]TVO60099.1 Flp pilus assembly protein CpaB [Spiribacter vilamensis]